jgi:hypothetical protein
VEELALIVGVLLVQIAEQSHVVPRHEGRTEIPLIYTVEDLNASPWVLSDRG